jgi:hypothetical protein
MWSSRRNKSRSGGPIYHKQTEESDNDSSIKSVLTSQTVPAVEWFYGCEHKEDADSKAAWEEKYDDILRCLAGERSSVAVQDDDCSNNEVNLWQLRELALLPGGLMCPQLRKRAWPTLLGFQSKILSNSIIEAGVTPMLMTACLSHQDLRAMEQDISRTVWNVQDHLMASKRQQKQLEEQMQLFIKQQRERRRVSFALLATVVHDDDHVVVSPTSLGSDPISDFEEEDSPRESDPQFKFASQYFDMKNKAADTSVVGDDKQIQDDDSSSDITSDDNTSILTHDTNFTLSSRVVRWRQTTEQELKVLFNVISSLLRTRPERSDYFEDDRYHYSPGLQDVTAVLIINLESPSIASLVLQQLAVTHFRDTMRPDRTVLDMAVDMTFMPLLDMVDPTLHQHLAEQAGLTLPPIARTWISSWFTQDVTDIRVASRIMDILLVSHPLAVVYLPVALLTVQRRKLLSDNDTLYATVRGLAAETLTVDKVEGVIRAALEIM